MWDGASVARDSLPRDKRGGRADDSRSELGRSCVKGDVQMADDNLIPCETCQTLIEGTHTHRFGPIEMECRDTHCKECAYQEAFRTNRLCKKPYRDPFPVPALDGRMPKSVRDELVKLHAQRDE